MAEGQKSGIDGLLDMERELACSICTDILYQPLTLLDCLHTFCASCLKEWFEWQAAAALHERKRTRPFTCPQCRESVRGTKADWRLTTLLEGYLKAHPDRAKSVEEIDEIRGKYKPGDDVIPKWDARRHGEDDYDSEDERLMAEVREMSMANVDPGSAGRRSERSTRRRQQTSTSATNDQLRPGGNGRSRQSSHSPSQQARLPETSLRQRDGDEPRVEHQASLRSLLSAGGSPVVSEDLQAEILQSIYAEGLLDGIDTDNLTTEQEEELTERIAEAYRRRQRRRDRSGHRDREHRTSQPAVTIPDSHSRHHVRTNSASAQAQGRTRPPISRPHLFEEQSNDPRRTHARSASGTSQQTAQSNTPTDAITPAARSATDLSTRSEPERQRRRRVSTNARSATDPIDQELRSHDHRIRASSTNPREEVRSEVMPASRSHPLDMVMRQGRPNNNSSPSLLPEPSPRHAVHPVKSMSEFAPEVMIHVQPAPSVKCDRCGKPDLQHDLHYHCAKCRGGHFDLCRSCYLNGQGCEHWYGFGYMAWENWHRAAPPGGHRPDSEGPHILTARRYLTPSELTSANSPPSQTSVLQEGAFCESCLTFSNDCYWHCHGWHCLEGAWGFCNACVLQGRHCTHPLLPTGHISTLRPPHNLVDPTNPSSPRGRNTFVHMPHLPRDQYVVVSPVLTDCDICRRPIPPNNTRFHCYMCSRGDYDVCTECYHNLVATGKISRSNGPNGWRRCLQGHRMAVVGYQDIPEEGAGQVRITVRDPVGGWRHKDEDSGSVALEANAQPPPDASLGMQCLALWTYWPAEGVMDELAFPKNAEIREVEDRNGEWFVGVYAGQVRLLPSNHVRRL